MKYNVETKEQEKIMEFLSKIGTVENLEIELIDFDQIKAKDRSGEELYLRWDEDKVEIKESKIV